MLRVLCLSIQIFYRVCCKAFQDYNTIVDHAELLSLCIFTAKKRIGGGGSNNLRRGGGGGHIPFAPHPPNNPPIFSFNFYVKQEKKSQMYLVEG